MRILLVTAPSLSEIADVLNTVSTQPIELVASVASRFKHHCVEVRLGKYELIANVIPDSRVIKLLARFGPINVKALQRELYDWVANKMRILVATDDPAKVVPILSKFPNKLPVILSKNADSLLKRSYVEITYVAITLYPGVEGLYFNANVLSDKRAAYLLFDQGSIPVEIDDLEARMVKAVEELNELLDDTEERLNAYSISS